MAGSLLDIDLQKLLFGAEPPSPVAGFLTPQQESDFKSQQTADTLLGALGGYQGQLYQGRSVFDKALGALTGAKKGRASTGNVYLDALQGQQKLTKGMLDVLNVQASNTKLGYENELSALQKTGQIEAYSQAFNSGDFELANAILIDAKAAIAQKLKSNMPDAPKLSEEVYYFGKSLEDKGIQKNTPLYNKAMIGYTNAAAPIDKAKYKDAFFKDIGKDYPGQNPSNFPSKTDINDLYNQQNNRPVNQQIPNQQTTQQYVPPTQIGIPSTGFVPAPDTETYTLGDYTIQQQPQQQFASSQVTNNQQVTNNGQVAPAQETINQQTPAPKTVAREVVSSTETINMLNGQQEQYWITKPNPNGTTVQEKYGVVGTRPMSEATKQQYANEKETKLNQIRKGANSYNELLLDIDALINSKGFDTFFGRLGSQISIVDEDGINTNRLWNKVLKGTALGNLVNMKLESPNGATPFGQLNYSELKMVLDEIIALEAGGNSEMARTMLEDFRTKMQNDSKVSLNFANKLYGTNSTKDFSYIYSPELIIDGEVMEGAVPGYVAKNSLGSRGSGLQNQYWYVLQDNGSGKKEYYHIKNPKSKNKSKFLTQEDVKTGNY
tara:strand:- start:2017 stop:3837 length:1821 start_codon:yes stop_codon:yes gene_type:complete